MGRGCSDGLKQLTITPMKRRLARRSLWIIAALGILGFGLSIESYREFGKAMMGEGTWCSFGELSSCEKAFESDYSVLFGRPISVYGAVAYFLATSMAVVGLINGGPYLLASLFHLALFSVPLLLATAYFAWALFFVVQTVCVLCVGDYLINLSIAGTTAYACWRLKPPYKSLFAWDMKSLFGTAKGRFQTVLMVVLLIILGAMVVRFEHWYYMRMRGFHLILENKINRIDTPWTQAFPTRGPVDAPIQVVSFGDYECPFCDMMKETWNHLLEKYPSLIRMTAVEYPLNSDCNPAAANNTNHPMACRATSLALYVLQAQGDEAFWRVHGEIYKMGQKLTPELLREIGRRAGLTEEQMKAAEEQAAHPKGLDNHLRIAHVLDFPGLPMTLLNGIRIQGYVEEWALVKIIKAELASKGLTLGDYKKR